MRREILQDWGANRGTPRIQVFLIFFRFAQLVRRRLGRRHPVSVAVALAYRAFGEGLVGCEIPVSVTAGPGLTIYHGYGLVVHQSTVLGARVTLRHGVTIGNDGRDDRAPVLEDDVEVGAGASILGDITIGEGASIGVHALVLHDVPAGARARASEATVRARETGGSDAG
ncbi:MAG: serine acetyltransferase [Nocardioides sp.]